MHLVHLQPDRVGDRSLAQVLPVEVEDGYVWANRYLELEGIIILASLANVVEISVETCSIRKMGEGKKERREGARDGIR